MRKSSKADFRSAKTCHARMLCLSLMRMTRGALQFSSLLAAGSLFTAGCSNLSPGENAGVFGATGGVAAGAIARSMGMSTADSIATGVAAGAMIGAVTYVIAKHEATERQRRIAEERARAITARMRAEAQQHARPEREHAEKPRAHRYSKTTRAEPEAASSPVRHTAAAAAAAKKLPRYIAVDTVKDERTTPRAQKSVMIFDTQAGQVVGNNVYDVQAPPKVGSTARFETYTAQYVGSGG